MWSPGQGTLSNFLITDFIVVLFCLLTIWRTPLLQEHLDVKKLSLFRVECWKQRPPQQPPQRTCPSWSYQNKGLPGIVWNVLPSSYCGLALLITYLSMCHGLVLEKNVHDYMSEGIFVYLARAACKKRCRIRCPSFWQEKKEKHIISLELCKPFVVMRYKADQMWRDGHSLKSNTLKCYR